jgi:hypothetical protein
MQNFRKAPDSIVEQVRRRLEKSTPGAELESVKLCSIPGTAFDATIFKYRNKGRRAVVAELARPDLPHIFRAFALTDNAIANAARIVGAVFSLAKRIREDRRFERNIIVLR